MAEPQPTAPASSPTTGERRWLPRSSRADVQLIGRVGSEPEGRLPSEANGRAWARLRVATERPDGDPDEADWHTVIARDRLAQFVARYLTRDRLVHVAGWLTYHEVEGRNGRHRVAEVHASSVLLLDRPTRAAPSARHDP